MRNLGVKNLDIYMTGKCNYQCGYCYGENDKFGTMDPEVYHCALEFGKYIQVECIELCGGEPLICPEFKDYVCKARNAGFQVILRTNGVFTEKYLDFIAVNCEWVGISIDGLPEINALMRSSRSNMTPEEQFQKPLCAIFNLKEKNPNIKILLASVAGRKNYMQMPAFADYLIQNKVPIDKWKVYEFIIDKFRSLKNQWEYALTETEFLHMCEQMPKEINGAPVILQSAHTDRVSANCLIVFHNGDINLLGKNYGNVAHSVFDDIIDRLLSDHALNVIHNNKEKTYGENDSYAETGMDQSNV